jgi:ribosomal protein S18 acetylase RimI-like enzyme
MRPAVIFTILKGMSQNVPIFEVCPAEFRAQALALVLADVAPSQRREIAGDLLRGGGAQTTAVDTGLWIARRDVTLCGAAWGQPQPGNTAIFWPPRIVAEERSETAETLAQRSAAALDAAGVAMSQALLRSRDAGDAPILERAGFHWLADLLYLTCEAAHFPRAPCHPEALEFARYDESMRGRLSLLIQQTYEGSRDCVGLGGHRKMNDVIDGYLATGSHPPEHWFIVRAKSSGTKAADVGVLLLADHAGPRHLELVYMGLVPQARGHGWGRQIAQFAQWIAGSAGAERLVLAVDAFNGPALSVYRETGFHAWDERSVFVRFAREKITAIGG